MEIYVKISYMSIFTSFIMCSKFKPDFIRCVDFTRNTD